jgi:hypothetical protein
MALLVAAFAELEEGSMPRPSKNVPPAPPVGSFRNASGSNSDGRRASGAARLPEAEALAGSAALGSMAPAGW